MTADSFDLSAAKPLWLITLADLALLLVGFFVLLQANQHLDKRALVAGLRRGFDARSIAPAHNAAKPMPVAAAGVFDFAAGSAALPSSTAGLIAWAQAATRDPRVSLAVTGGSDGSLADVDSATGSGAILATDRARAVAAALAAAHVPLHRMTIATGGKGRRVVVSLAFSGEPR